MKRWWILGGIILVAVAAAMLWFVFLEDTATPITAGDVRFEGTVGDQPGDPGIYLYETSGFEEVDALGGARHDYPAETYFVIEDGPCGPVTRWQALTERWEEWEHCGPDLAVTTDTSYHEWFSIPDTGVASCSEEAIFPPPGVTTWTSVCVREGGRILRTSTLVGTETLVIDGVEVETIHIRTTEVTEGRTVGASTIETWRLPGTPLVVRRQTEESSDTTSRIGDIHYVEQATMQVRSLYPTG